MVEQNMNINPGDKINGKQELLYSNIDCVSNFREHLSTNLRIARLNCGLGVLDKGLTQSEVAVIVGVTKSQIANYESGRRVPSLDVFSKLCAVYNVDCNKVLGLHVSSRGATAAQLLLNEKKESTKENQDNSDFCYL